MQDEGHEIPILDEKPEVIPEALPFWEAFVQLSHSRNVGMSLGAIPISEVLAYCVYFSIVDIDERGCLLRIISDLDSHYLELNKPKETKK
jgi:hypothetical protein